MYYGLWVAIWCRDSTVYNPVSLWRILLLISIHKLRAEGILILCVQDLRNLEHHGKGWEEQRVPPRAWKIQSSERWSSSTKGWMGRPSEYSQLVVLGKSAWIACLWGTTTGISWLMQGWCSQSMYSKLFLPPALRAVHFPLLSMSF